jgi:ribosomal protein S18 acetylase RimI-like enzyme
MSKAQLSSAGFDPDAVFRKLATQEYVGWVCEDGDQIVGFATGDTKTGEVLVVAVLPEHEGKKIGRTLLSHLLESMIRRGCTILWLEASPDPNVRAHGFYRANGWLPSGRKASNGDEILEFIGNGS